MKLPHEWSDDEIADVQEQALAALRAAGRTVVDTRDATYLAGPTVGQQVDLTAELVAGMRRAITADDPQAAAFIAWTLIGAAKGLYKVFADEAAARAN